VATYWDVLDAVRTVVQGLSALDGVPVVIRKWPGFLALQGSVREVVIAPRRDLAEVMAELQFSGNAWIDYEVFVILVTEARYDEETLQWRLNRRLELRQALYETDAVASEVPAQFDVDYDPSPSIDTSSLPETLDWTAQKYTYRTSEARS